MPKQFTDQRPLADGAKLSAVHAITVRPNHEDLILIRQDMVDLFYHRTIRWMPESNDISLPDRTKKEGDFSYQYKIPFPVPRRQAIA